MPISINVKHIELNVVGSGGFSRLSLAENHGVINEHIVAKARHTWGRAFGKRVVHSYVARNGSSGPSSREKENASQANLM